MGPKECVEIACQHSDPADAAKALVDKAVSLWAEKNEYVDDVTALVIFVSKETFVDSLF